MDSTKYSVDYETHGVVKIEDIIDPKELSKAKEYSELFKDLTLEGRVTRENRTPEQIQKDLEAIALLQQLKDEINPALAWGFMLYNEAAITKCYWTQRVGKLRQNKREFFEMDKYLEWLTEIFATLNGEHPKYHDALYYYKLNGTGKNGENVGDYDVMNSFRTHWNMYFLKILAIYLYQEDQKYSDYGISIDAALENENGAGNHLEAELAKNIKTVVDAETQTTFLAIEEFLKSFNFSPLCDPVPLNTGTKATGVTYRDCMLAIVDGSWTTGKTAYEKFRIGPSIQQKITSKLRHEMNKQGFDIEDFGKYLEAHRAIAIDIIEGKDVSFLDEVIED